MPEKNNQENKESSITECFPKVKVDLTVEATPKLLKKGQLVLHSGKVITPQVNAMMPGSKTSIG